MDTDSKALPESELEIWVLIGDGKAMRVRAALVEEGMPSPGEADAERQPFMGEILAALRFSRNHRNLSLTKPF